MRPIDADALIKRINYKTESGMGKTIAFAFKHFIDDAPTIETHGDSINRADAIELLTKIVFDEPPYLDSETLCRIYAEEQINALPSADAVHESCEDCPLYDKERHNCPRFNKVIPRTIAEAVQGWVPCSEMLPEKGEVVLITNGKGNVRCGQYRSEHDVRDGMHYWWWKGKTVESVLAWMPLPKPYKGGDDE